MTLTVRPPTPVEVERDLEQLRGAQQRARFLRDEVTRRRRALFSVEEQLTLEERLIDTLRAELGMPGREAARGTGDQAPGTGEGGGSGPGARCPAPGASPPSGGAPPILTPAGCLRIVLAELEAVSGCAVTIEDVVSDRRESLIVLARHAYAWLAALAGHSYPCTARAIGRTHHNGCYDAAHRFALWCSVERRVTAVKLRGRLWAHLPVALRLDGPGKRSERHGAPPAAARHRAPGTGHRGGEATNRRTA